MIGRALWRIIVVAFGFVVAAIIAAIVLVTLGLERATQVAQGKDVLGNSIEGVVDFLQASARLVSAMTLVPALAVVVIGEVARIRSALYYVIGGGVALVAIPLFARFATAGGGPMPALMVWQIFATAGFAGGYVYWLVSGRRA